MQLSQKVHVFLVLQDKFVKVQDARHASEGGLRVRSFAKHRVVEGPQNCLVLNEVDENLLF